MDRKKGFHYYGEKNVLIADIQKIDEFQDFIDIFNKLK